MPISTGAANVDPREVDYYTTRAAAWWDPSGPFWPLHRLNRLRTAYLRDTLARHLGRNPQSALPLSGTSVLDVGCGGGILSESMARLGASVLGVDVVSDNIRTAEQHAAGSPLDVRYEHVDVDELVSRGSRFDVVLNMEVVEHVPDVPQFMRACCALVEPGGLMAVATLNRTPIAWLTAIIGAEYILGWLPKGTHRWQQFVTPTEVERLLIAGGLRCTDRTGVRVNPVTRRFSLSPRMAVNYMVIGQKSATPAFGGA
ncbi:MAG: bifunctional 2-polyprenyl-6-hydroxyphenol methylase/3-demethylubiquinol 3-O-methyltransferase UbiG [Pseudomonadota bacterium]